MATTLIGLITNVQTVGEPDETNIIYPTLSVKLSDHITIHTPITEALSTHLLDNNLTDLDHITHQALLLTTDITHYPHPNETITTQHMTLVTNPGINPS